MMNQQIPWKWLYAIYIHTHIYTHTWSDQNKLINEYQWSILIVGYYVHGEGDRLMNDCQIELSSEDNKKVLDISMMKNLLMNTDSCNSVLQNSELHLNNNKADKIFELQEI